MYMRHTSSSSSLLSSSSISTVVRLLRLLPPLLTPARDPSPMKMPVALLLLLALSNLIRAYGVEGSGVCDIKLRLEPRPHSVSITEFGAVGDGKTLNTLAFQNAIFYLKSFADKGGAQLYVPPGKWLTGSFNLTSHLTLFLEKGAVILGSKDPNHFEVVNPLPSYGRGIELPGKRYWSLINGYKLEDVVITGDKGTIDGQGSVWWESFSNHTLNHSRPHLVEFESSQDVVVSNLTFLNAPAYSIHPVYCSNVLIQNVSISAPPESPCTVGIVPDSSDEVCIEDSMISMGHDAISLKSGWDEYGIAYGRPTTNVHIRQVDLLSSSGSSISFGSQMSGGISDVKVEHVYLHNSPSGIEFRTTKGRGGYIKEISVSDAKLEKLATAFVANGHCGTHPDDNFDPDALPLVSHITLKNIKGSDIDMAGNLVGIPESPFTSLHLSNITLSMSSGSSKYWRCLYVSGRSDSVTPEPCPELMSSSSESSLVISLGGGSGRAAS